MSVATLSPAPVLADVIRRSATGRRAVVADVALVLAGVIVVSLLAKITFYIGPVPITGQTLGVLAVGVALGARRGAIALTSYMLAGLAGLPVFAGPTAGLAYVLSPSFGFVIGFIPAAFVAGMVAERAWDRKPLLALVGFTAATAVPFLTGVPYLALALAVVSGEHITFASVLDAGLWPFIVPGLIKAALAAVVVPAVWRLTRSRGERRA